MVIHTQDLSRSECCQDCRSHGIKRQKKTQNQSRTKKKPIKQLRVLHTQSFIRSGSAFSV